MLKFRGFVTGPDEPKPGPFPIWELMISGIADVGRLGIVVAAGGEIVYLRLEIFSNGKQLFKTSPVAVVNSLAGMAPLSSLDQQGAGEAAPFYVKGNQVRVTLDGAKLGGGVKLIPYQ